jgi:hypothetical protein
MREIKDAKGNRYTFEITVSSIKTVRKLAGVDLYSLIDDKLAGLQKLLADPCELIDVLYVLCCRCGQDDPGDITFGQGFSGPCILEIADAFLQELLDFFPDRRVAEALRKLVSKSKMAAAELMEEALEKAEQVTVAELVSKSKTTFGSSPESSELTPAR